MRRKKREATERERLAAEAAREKLRYERSPAGRREKEVARLTAIANSLESDVSEHLRFRKVDHEHRYKKIEETGTQLVADLRDEARWHALTEQERAAAKPPRHRGTHEGSLWYQLCAVRKQLKLLVNRAIHLSAVTLMVQRLRPVTRTGH